MIGSRKSAPSLLQELGKSNTVGGLFGKKIPNYLTKILLMKLK